MEESNTTSIKLRFAERLREEWRSRQERNPAFSQRAFARHLDVDPSDLNKLMRGSRTPGKKIANRMGQRLGWIASDTEICRLYEKRAVNDEADSTLLAEELFDVFSHWRYFAILSLLGTDGFKPEIGHIARRLSLSQSEVEIAVSRLKRLGLLGEDETGKWIDKSKGGSTSLGDPNKTSAARRQLQKSYVAKSLLAIDRIPIDRRNHTSMTMAVDPRKLESAREMVSVFRRDLVRFLERSKSRTDVYCLNIGLFPLTGESVKETT